MEHKDFIPALWYHRTLSIPQTWQGQRILLHFGGVDYRSQVFIDGEFVAEHYGGAASFTVDITRNVKAGGLKQVRVTPDLDNQQFFFEPEFYQTAEGQRLSITISDQNRKVFSREVAAAGSSLVTAYIR